MSNEKKMINEEEELMARLRAAVNEDAKGDTEDKYAGQQHLVYIDVEKLHAHPDNPRKELGDLTELADSIRAKGVMQNLTVVPFKSRTNPKFNGAGRYTVIIGHRRLAAAKEAGLTSLPCVIVEMSEQEQVATMLLENMQRSDLTAYEQAQGFRQLQMDFGMSTEEISKQTGFSKTTVHRRLKMAELDQKKLQVVSARQITIGDLDRLAEIKDLTVRNKVLDEIGTRNFDSKLQGALQDQEREENRARWRELLKARDAIEIPYEDVWNGKYGMPDVSYVSVTDAKLPDALKDVEPLYYAMQYSSVYFRTKKETTKKNKAETQQDREAAECSERKDKLQEAFDRAFQLRRAFIKGVGSRIVNTANFERLVEHLVLCGMGNDFEHFNEQLFLEMSGLKDGEQLDTGDPFSWAPLRDVVNKRRYDILLYYAYARMETKEDCFDWWGDFEPNDSLDLLYHFLESIGYMMSDEEMELMNGTSALYRNGANREAKDA